MIKSLRVILVLIIMAGVIACGGSESSPESGAGPTKSGGDPKIPGSNPAPGQPAQPGQPGQPGQPQKPSQADLAKVWKSLRFTYRTISKNGKPVCEDATDVCATWGMREEYGYYDYQKSQKILQVMAWNFISSQSDHTTYRYSIPIFADRGTFDQKGSRLLYDFEGTVAFRGASEFVFKIHIDVDTASRDKLAVHVDANRAGQDVHDDFVLQVVPGTEVQDIPADFPKGVIATHETGTVYNNGAYQASRCYIQSLGEGQYLMSAKKSFIRNSEEHHGGPVALFKDDFGLFALVAKAWLTTAQVENVPGAQTMDYWAVYNVVDGKSKAYPISGEGLKKVTSDIAPELREQIRKKVKAICDEVYR